MSTIWYHHKHLVLVVSRFLRRLKSGPGDPCRPALAPRPDCGRLAGESGMPDPTEAASLRCVRRPPGYTAMGENLGEPWLTDNRTGTEKKNWGRQPTSEKHTNPWIMFAKNTHPPSVLLLPCMCFNVRGKKQRTNRPPVYRPMPNTVAQERRAPPPRGASSGVLSPETRTVQLWSLPNRTVQLCSSLKTSPVTEKEKVEPYIMFYCFF